MSSPPLPTLTTSPRRLPPPRPRVATLGTPPRRTRTPSPRRTTGVSMLSPETRALLSLIDARGQPLPETPVRRTRSVSVIPTVPTTTISDFPIPPPAPIQRSPQFRPRRDRMEELRLLFEEQERQRREAEALQRAIARSLTPSPTVRRTPQKKIKLRKISQKKTKKVKRKMSSKRVKKVTRRRCSRKKK